MSGDSLAVCERPSIQERSQMTTRRLPVLGIVAAILVSLLLLGCARQSGLSRRPAAVAASAANGRLVFSFAIPSETLVAGTSVPATATITNSTDTAMVLSSFVFFVAIKDAEGKTVYQNTPFSVPAPTPRPLAARTTLTVRLPFPAPPPGAYVVFCQPPTQEGRYPELLSVRFRSVAGPANSR